MVNLTSASFIIIVLLHKGFTHIQSQIKPKLLFGEIFTLSALELAALKLTLLAAMLTSISGSQLEAVGSSRGKDKESWEQSFSLCDEKSQYMNRLLDNNKQMTLYRIWFCHQSLSHYRQCLLYQSWSCGVLNTHKRGCKNRTSCVSRWHEKCY